MVYGLQIVSVVLRKNLQILLPNYFYDFKSLKMYSYTVSTLKLWLTFSWNGRKAQIVTSRLWKKIEQKNLEISFRAIEGICIHKNDKPSDCPFKKSSKMRKIPEKTPSRCGKNSPNINPNIAWRSMLWFLLDILMAKWIAWSDNVVCDLMLQSAQWQC